MNRSNDQLNEPPNGAPLTRFSDDAHVSGAQGQRVVHAVPDHGDHAPLGLEVADELGLVLREQIGKGLSEDGKS